MAERSGAIENQARDGASERSESSVGEEIGAPPDTQGLNGERIQSGLTNEKGFRGEHFEHIPDFRGKGDFKRDSGIRFRYKVNLSRKSDFIPQFGIGM